MFAHYIALFQTSITNQINCFLFFQLIFILLIFCFGSFVARNYFTWYYSEALPNVTILTGLSGMLRSFRKLFYSYNKDGYDSLLTSTNSDGLIPMLKIGSIYSLLFYKFFYRTKQEIWGMSTVNMRVLNAWNMSYWTTQCVSYSLHMRKCHQNISRIFVKNAGWI